MDGVKGLLQAREKMWQNWQGSEQTLLKKREAITRVSNLNTYTVELLSSGTVFLLFRRFTLSMELAIFIEHGKILDFDFSYI